MNTRSLSKRLTIIIPSKNEGIILYNCVQYIARQNHINGVRVIIADASDDIDSLLWIKKTQTDFKHILKIILIKGGYPAEGRLNGSMLVSTPYMLFLDADILLTNPKIIVECLFHWKDLTTVPFSTDKPYRWVFRMFDIFQWLSSVLKTPFAVGGFQLWKTGAYWSVGGYNSEERFAEDYSISQKVNPKEFKVVNIMGAYTSSRRFKSKGVLWMFKIMINSYLNRKNPEFFKKSHGYWE